MRSSLPKAAPTYIGISFVVRDANSSLFSHVEPTLSVRTLEAIDAPFRKLSLGLFTVDKRDYRIMEAEKRQYPKSTVQDALEGALTLGVIGVLIWLAVLAKRKWL